MQDEKPDSQLEKSEPPVTEASIETDTPDLAETDPSPAPPAQPVVVHSPKSQKKQIITTVAIALVLILAGVGSIWWAASRHHDTAAATTKSNQTTKPKTTTKTEGLVLDTTKDYGNKYADGLLPVGDGKYSSAEAKTGYVYTCGGYAKNLQTESGGAGKRGPWFTTNNTEYNVNQKSHVQGNVMWSAEFTDTASGGTRTITTNDLPSHPTGVFPIAMSDPAYAYDKNPNTIKGQTLTFSLPTSPTYSATPQCMSGQSGVMLTGVVVFNGFDAGGRDAGAWEVQDSCDGHPQAEGEYHYHTLSSCIKDVSVRTVIGYALDGFPITGPQLSANNILTTSDLDECHGITSQVILGGKTVTTYHYVMTQDFPYSVSCFRATPTDPPGQKPLPH